MNNAARRLLAAPNARPGDDLFDRAPPLRDWLSRELDGSSPPDQVVQLDGVDLRPSLTLLGDQRANGALIYLRDDQELARQAQEIKLASLGRLTASIAHNIRNPLSSVTHATQLLAESENLGDDDRHLLDIMRRNALRIDETVTSVLELSRRQQAQPSAIDLRDWLTDFCNEYRDSNQLASERLQLDLPATKADEIVRVDTRHLGQILRNLCDNGFKHGGAEHGQAHVGIALDRNPNSGECTVTVTDDVPGVAAEHRGAIFEPFFTTSSSGTGLGLYASSELAQANGMRLEYLDEPGAGGRFRLTFNE